MTRRISGRHTLDKCLEEGGDTRMKLGKLFDDHLLAGIVLGALIGLHYPLEAHKGILVVLGVVMGLKVIGFVK